MCTWHWFAHKKRVSWPCCLFWAFGASSTWMHGGGVFSWQFWGSLRERYGRGFSSQKSQLRPPFLHSQHQGGPGLDQPYHHCKQVLHLPLQRVCVFWDLGPSHRLSTLQAACSETSLKSVGERWLVPKCEQATCNWWSHKRRLKRILITFAHIQPGFGPHKYPGVSFPLETDAGAQTIPCEALHKPL